MMIGDLVSVTIGATIPLLSLPNLSKISITGEMKPDELGVIVGIRAPNYWHESAEIKVLSSTGAVGWANSLNFETVKP